MKNIIIYVSCALTHAPQEYKDDIEAFKGELRKVPGVTVLDFCPPAPGEKQTKLSPKEVYQKDINEGVAVADLIIAEVSLPSTGLGLELGKAIGEYKIPTLLFAKKGAVVSKLILGIPTHVTTAPFAEYSESLLEMLPGIAMYLEYYRKIRT